MFCMLRNLTTGLLLRNIWWLKLIPVNLFVILYVYTFKGNLLTFFHTRIKMCRVFQNWLFWNKEVLETYYSFVFACNKCHQNTFDVKLYTSHCDFDELLKKNSHLDTVTFLDILCTYIFLWHFAWFMDYGKASSIASPYSGVFY